MLRAILVATLCLAPTAFATSLTDWPVALGIAQQGTTNEHEGAEVCLTALTPMTLEVSLVAGSPTDVLRVVADAVGEEDPSALATLAAPAVIRYVSPDSCARFTVEGLAVSEIAAYQGIAIAGGDA